MITANHNQFNWDNWQYNCYRTNIGKAITINIYWTNGSFCLSINGRKYKDAFDDLDTTKTAAIKKSMGILVEAIRILQEGNK